MLNKVLAVFIVLGTIGCSKKKDNLFVNKKVEDRIVSFVAGDKKSAEQSNNFRPPAYSLLLENAKEGCKLVVIQDLEIDTSKSIGYFYFEDVPIALYASYDDGVNFMSLDKLSTDWSRLDEDLISGALLTTYEPTHRIIWLNEKGAILKVEDKRR